ncbi:hypothetical protein LP416_27035 [Polaromonas sp. P2-4]|nr:hypothetical protein LP416_27035 [Polaromonas sp. P2-4]
MATVKKPSIPKAPNTTPNAPAVQEAARPVSVKPAPAKAEVTKPASKKAAPKKSPTAKAPAPKKAPVKKAAAKRLLSKAFAPAKAEKAVKPKKPKLVRDSFTIPKAEYLVLDELKQRAAKLTRPAKKSELLRAGIKALAALSDAAFLTALEQVPAIKTGRPASTK